MHNFFRFCFLLSLFSALVSITTTLVTAHVSLGASPQCFNGCVLCYICVQHTCTHTHTHIRTHVHMHAHAHAHAHTYMYVCTCRHKHTHDLCTHTHTNTHMHIYMYMYTHTHTFSIIHFIHSLFCISPPSPSILPPACLFCSQCLHAVLLPRLTNVAGWSGTVSASCYRCQCCTAKTTYTYGTQRNPSHLADTGENRIPRKTVTDGNCISLVTCLHGNPCGTCCCTSCSSLAISCSSLEAQRFSHAKQRV